MAIIAPPSKKVQALIIISAAIFISVLAYRVDAEQQFSDFFSSFSKNSGNNKVSTLDVVSSSSTFSNSGDNTGKNYVDQASLLSTQATTTPGDPDDPTNLSQQLSRNLFSNFMALQQSGQLTDDAQAELVSDSIAKISPPNVSAKYTINDIKIVPTSQTSLHTYGNDIGRILVSYAPKMVNQNNENALKLHSQMIADISKVQIPSDLGLIHLQLLNGMNVSNQMLSIMLSSENDPVKALIAIKGFQDNEVNVQAVFTSIAATFKKDGIIFTSNESGSIWNNY